MKSTNKRLIQTNLDTHWNVSTNPVGHTTATAVPRFVRSVYDMLQNEDQRILSWSVDGSHFQVYDVPRLETEVLRKYFKHGKFSSFQRQLNNFGFHKWTKTRASVATFSHDLLVRCHPSQLAVVVSQMKQKTPTSTMSVPETTTASAKRPRSLLVTTTTEHTAPVKKYKMSPRDVTTVDNVNDDLSDVNFASILEPLWLLEEDSCCKDELLVGALEAVDLEALDWDAVVSPVETDVNGSDSISGADIDLDCAALCGLFDEDDVPALLSDLCTAPMLSDCEVESFVGCGFDIDVSVDEDTFLFV
ncbi:Transient receptor potential Ca2 channel (TRP-CC) family protein [Phytophthora palmivora]|uniref:Transient receptor potential Ca2 channel (TRP-CC) family protein n=2 Tax=Phytophthora palmivora TaxID=4796 RepID=A0A2P4YK99_9STRA|nr:Transient receptor potential Ca2 channel (TRP-CC) family protein [Phytophthora palmivora]